MAIVRRKLWGGIIEYDEDDTPRNVRNFNLIGKSPQFWLAQSVGLHRAAEILMHDHNGQRRAMIFSEPIALMLGGYAIETLLKMVTIATVVKQRANYTVPSKTADFVMRTHDLKKLVTAAKLRTNKVDASILERLSKYVIWGGRYPIPLDAVGYVLPMLFDHTLNEPPLWDAYVRVYRKLHRLAIKKAL